jgi:hypothetical protein
MAKGNKQDQSRSLLKIAYEAFERGDVVEARRLSHAVLGGKLGPDEVKTAGELAKKLSIPEAPVDESPQAVAQELISRSGVPPKPYLFVAAVAAAFIGLVILAIVRY